MSDGSRSRPHGLYVIDGPATLEALVIEEPMTIVAGSGDASIVSMEGAVLSAEVRLGPGVDLSRCLFGDAVGLEHLRFSEVPFALRGRYRAPIDPSERVCRELRVAAESSRLFGLAADLHIGELRARARRSGPLESFGIAVFGLVGGYGHRPLRPILAWFALVFAVSGLIVTWPQRFIGQRFTIGGQFIDSTNWHSVLVKYVIRNALAVFSALDYGDVHNDGYALLLAMKVATTVLLVFTAMGVRSRLRR